MTKQCTRCELDWPLDDFYLIRGGRARRAMCKACVRESRAHYRDSHREQINADKREHHAQHPHLKWRYRYEERMREAGMLPLVGDFTRADVVDRYGDACAHCGGPFQELDHYPVPVSAGGPHTLDNVRPSCVPCNRRSWRQAA